MYITKHLQWFICTEMFYRMWYIYHIYSYHTTTPNHPFMEKFC